MKTLEQMTRRELATIIVEDQIKRGIVKAENKEMQIKSRLNGKGYAKSMSWNELYNAVKYFI